MSATLLLATALAEKRLALAEAAYAESSEPKQFWERRRR
jgi:hypothetical protein